MHNYSCGASFTSLLYHANEVLRTPRQEPLLSALRRAPHRSGSRSPVGGQQGLPSPRLPSAGSAAAAAPSPLPAGVDRQPAARGRSARRRRSAGGILRARCRVLLRLAPRAASAGDTGPAAGSSPRRGRAPLSRSRYALGAGSVEGLRGDEAAPRSPGSAEAPPGERRGAPYLEPGTIPRKLRRGGRAASSRSRGRRAGVQSRRGIRRREAAGAPRRCAGRGAPAAGAEPALPSPAPRSSLAGVEG